MSGKMIKTAVIGFPTVGKSSLVNRFTRNLFSNQYISTLGVDFHMKNVEIDNTTLKYIIYDIGGELEMINIRKKYLQSSDVIFIVFDLSMEATWCIEPYVEESQSFNKDVEIFIIGNKTDLVDPKGLELAGLEELASDIGARVIFTSAKLNQGVEEAFIEAGRAFV